MIRCLWSPKPPMASLFTLEVVHRSHSKDTLGCWTGICSDVRTEQKENTIILTGDGMGLAMVTIFAGRSTRLCGRFKDSNIDANTNLDKGGCESNYTWTYRMVTYDL